MKTAVVMETPAFRLRGGSGWSNETDQVVEVSYDMLRKAPVGRRWVARNRTNIVRDAYGGSATVVYRTEWGVAVLIERWGTTDSPKSSWVYEEPELVWFGFAEEPEEAEEDEEDEGGD